MPPEAGGLLVVHAHPDDEAMATGGLIARAVAQGHRVDLVTCTGGEEGEIHDPDLDPAEAAPRLAEIRRRELECAVAALADAASDGGRLELHMLGYRDSGMMGTEANERPDSFWQQDLDEPTRRVVALIRTVRPAAVVTYDANGNYGHPDHINAHRVAARAWEAAADPSCYPDAGAPHVPQRFYQIAFNREAWSELTNDMRERGIPLPWGMDEAEGADSADAAQRAEGAVSGEATEAAGGERASGTASESAEPATSAAEPASEDKPPDEFGTPDAEVTTRVDVSAYAAYKRACMACHRTQRQDLGWLLELPDDLAERALATEHFVLRRRRLPDGSVEEVPTDYRDDWLLPD